MNRLILLAALSLAAASGAEAKCTKANLNGDWSIFDASGASGPAVTISNGTFIAAGATYTITSFGNNCRGSGIVTSATAARSYVVTSEYISPTSSAKPNMLTLSILGNEEVEILNLFRR